MICGTVQGSERVYKTPANDFELSTFQLPEGGSSSFETGTADILLVTSGQARLASGGQQLELSAGESAVVFPGPVDITAKSELEMFRATVPVHNPE